MAKKLSNIELMAERTRLTLRSDILEIVATETADDTYRHRDGRDTYTWKVYRLAGAAGGFLVCVFDGFVNKHKAVYYVERLDTAILQVQQRASVFADCGMCDAVSRFHSARYNLTQAA
jgi:hypothetical protein